MELLPSPPSKRREDEIRVGQKVISRLTGIEYEVKKMLQDNSVLLHSEDQNASALVHKDYLNTFYVSAKSRGVQGSKNPQ